MSRIVTFTGRKDSRSCKNKNKKQNKAQPNQTIAKENKNKTKQDKKNQKQIKTNKNKT